MAEKNTLTQIYELDGSKIVRSLFVAQSNPYMAGSLLTGS